MEKIDLEPLLAQAKVSAVHLEMRDDCGPSDEPMFSQWRNGRTVEQVADSFAGWSQTVPRHTARGVAFRRARIVSEPVTEYVRFLHAITASTIIPAGEDVRWLPRRRASDVALPGNDFWLIDDRLVRFGHFSGDGLILGHEVTTAAPAVELCASAFAAVWERATPHADYKPTVG